ncbi:hypothetical protein CGMCC3_g18028 [Colletotrichum fructicola]|nr:uncharacterized protein CGMCC3_g18028 [Colletotrichum fructicola]KAE9565788.1 hypothetical protein CGMCC3_g18028 [Colletotrichum fructicola]
MPNSIDASFSPLPNGDTAAMVAESLNDSVGPCSVKSPGQILALIRPLLEPIRKMMTESIPRETSVVATELV